MVVMSAAYLDVKLVDYLVENLVVQLVVTMVDEKVG